LSERQIIDEILQPGGLSVVFQPIVRLDGARRSLHAIEGLTRGPKGTNMESALVLFEYVRRKHQEMKVDRACVTAVLRAAAGLDQKAAVTLNVHASTLSRDPEFLTFLGDAAESQGVPLGRLTVEVVQHAPVWDGPSFQSALDALRHIGVGIALDDVCLGQSNFRMMLDCRPDYFKVDGYFVRGCHGDYHRQAILESIAGLAVKFGAAVIAEGVEDEADLETVQRIGVVLAQGHLFSEALPVDEVNASIEALGFT